MLTKHLLTWSKLIQSEVWKNEPNTTFIHGNTVLEKTGRLVAFWPAMDGDGFVLWAVVAAEAEAAGEAMGAEAEEKSSTWSPRRVNGLGITWSESPPAAPPVAGREAIGLFLPWTR